MACGRRRQFLRSWKAIATIKKDQESFVKAAYAAPEIDSSRLDCRMVTGLLERTATSHVGVDRRISEQSDDIATRDWRDHDRTLENLDEGP